MTRPTFPVTVRDIETEAEYQGKIYEQTVTVKPTNDSAISVPELALFDDSQTVMDELRGEQVDLVVSVLPSRDFEVLEHGEKGVSEAEEAISIWSYTFVGEVVTRDLTDEWYLNPDDPLLLLDVGAGRIVVKPDRELLEMVEEGAIDTGTYLKVHASRTEVIDCSK